MRLSTLLGSLICAAAAVHGLDDLLGPLSPGTGDRAQGARVNRYEPRTNGERAQLGLPLLPPTRTRRKRQAQVSCGVPVRGKLLLATAAGEVMGYLGKPSPNFGQVTYGTSVYAMIVSVPAANCMRDPFDMSIVSEGYSYPFLSAAGAPTGYDFTTGAIGWATLTASNHLDAGTPPSLTVGNMIQDNAAPQYYPAESQIWSLSSGNMLSATWTNADGSPHAASIMFNRAGPGVGMVYLVGDLEFLKATYGSQLATLTLATIKFVPI